MSAQKAHRSSHLQLRIADGITAFAGSMPFVYLHAAVFAGWMLLVEPSPWPTLTLVVSLEATRAVHALTAELHQRLLVDQHEPHPVDGAAS